MSRKYESTITLERILSLIPQDEKTGKSKHGAKKVFAESIGITPQDLSDWSGGRSASYYDKLYEISAKYNVSVEWLEGKTDVKNPAAPKNDGIAERLSNLDSDLLKLLSDFVVLAQENPDTAKRYLAFAVQELRSGLQSR